MHLLSVNTCNETRLPATLDKAKVFKMHRNAHFRIKTPK